ncbi:MAG: hypothetical protein UU67_C0056G0001, partial [Candidatus Daviesbacteria bacterium GW2011_GWB1_41_5]
PPPNFDGNYAGDLDSNASTPAGMSAHWVMTVSGGKVTKLEIQNWHLVCATPTVTSGVLVQVLNGSPVPVVSVNLNGSFEIGPRPCDHLVGRFIDTSTIQVTYTRVGGSPCWIDGTCPAVNLVVTLNRQ